MRETAMMPRGKLRPYDSYRESNASWLGMVPENWALRRMKTVLLQRSEKGYPNEPLLAATQSKGVVQKDEYENRTTLALKDLELLKLVRVGDFVISLRSFQGGIEYARSQGIISPAYTILYPQAVRQHGYLAHLFKSKPFIENLCLHLTGIRQGQSIDYSKLGCSLLPLPSDSEQTAIIHYLDYMDRRIQRYIRAKQKLIKLLEEQKQAIIHQAVTGQIDVRTGKPYPAYKPSGVEWLGDVPEQWEVTRLSHVVHSSNAGEVIDKGWWGKGAEILYTCAREPMHSDFATFPDWKRTTGEDLLLTRNGTPYVHRPVRNAIYSNVVQRIILRTGSSRDWIAHSLEVATRMMKGYGVSIESLNYDMWKILILMMPESEEQEKIIKYLHAVEEHFEPICSMMKTELHLLSEYRTRLISDVVTGKLDVREAAANLPEELEEKLPDEEPAEDEDASDLEGDMEPAEDEA
jgi:type I restriction enzyme, S subunit